MRRQRDKLAEQHRTRRLTLLAAHHAELRQLYRHAAARYAGAALAVTTAAIDGTDPARALSTAALVALETAGRPTTDLAHPATGLTRHRRRHHHQAHHRPARHGAGRPRRRGRRTHLPAPPLDPARPRPQHVRHLPRRACRDGRLVRLRLRLPPEGTNPHPLRPRPAPRGAAPSAERMTPRPGTTHHRHRR